MEGFDVVLHAELLWKDTYPLHALLLQTTAQLLRPGGILLASFAHRPTAAPPSGQSQGQGQAHTAERDLEFLALASTRFGFSAPTKVLSSSKYQDCDDKDSQTCVNLFALTRTIVTPQT